MTSKDQHLKSPLLEFHQADNGEALRIQHRESAVESSDIETPAVDAQENEGKLVIDTARKQ